MFKITGAILLIAGTTGVGVSLRSEMKQRLYHVNCMQHIFTLLASEIGYAKATMEEACRSICAKAENPYRRFLEQIYRGIEANQGVSFAVLWRTAMKEQLSALPLKEKEWDVIDGFADYTGCMDMELQRKLIDCEIQDLEKLAAQIESEIATQGRLYITFGVMSGLFLTVLFL